MRRDALLRRLVDIQYERNDVDFHRGTFRVRGDIVEVFPAYEARHGDPHRVLRRRDRGASTEIDPLRGKVKRKLDATSIFPARTTSRPPSRLRQARCRVDPRRAARAARASSTSRNKLLEKQRLEQRTMYDLEMLEQMGFCKGIENYSRHLSGRAPGEPPPTLIDYFPKDFLLVVDESHQTVPQIGAMYSGDRSRKETLVEFGFRLPTRARQPPAQVRGVGGARAADDLRLGDAGRLRARSRREGVVVEQVIRPTGLLDPEIEVRPVGAPGRRPARRDPRARRRAASACWSPR